MKAPFSEYLNQIEQPLKRVISLLGNDYEYVSALASDSKGLNIRISAHAKSVSDKTMANERGIGMSSMSCCASPARRFMKPRC